MKKLLLIAVLLGCSLSLWAEGCPLEKPLKGRNRCYACDEDVWGDVSKEDCHHYCPNSFSVTYTETSVIEIETGQFAKRLKCLPCDSRDLKVEEDECVRCSNRFFQDGLCLFKELPNDAEGPLVDIYYSEDEDLFKEDFGVFVLDDGPHLFGKRIRFLPCNTLRAAHIHSVYEELAKKCTNREIIVDEKEQKISYLKECPEGTLKSKYGCFPCKKINDHFPSAEQECLKCKEYEYKDGKCILKGT